MLVQSDQPDALREPEDGAGVASEEDPSASKPSGTHLSWVQSKQRARLPGRGLRLFAKAGQIQLACGLTPHLINLLSYEQLNSLCQYLISPGTDKIS